MARGTGALKTKRGRRDTRATVAATSSGEKTMARGTGALTTKTYQHVRAPDTKVALKMAPKCVNSQATTAHLQASLETEVVHRTQSTAFCPLKRGRRDTRATVAATSSGEKTMARDTGALKTKRGRRDTRATVAATSSGEKNYGSRHRSIEDEEREARYSGYSGSNKFR